MTVSSLGNRKNELVLSHDPREGVQAYDGSVRFVHAVREAGLRRAVVSASANCREVLEAAGIADLFEVRCRRGRRRAGAPARKAGSRHVPGRSPQGSTWRQARRRCSRTRSPESPRDGRTFGLVVGVDRAGQADALRAHGADIVVSDLAELLSPA